MMTAAELIIELQKYPPSSEVQIVTSEGEGDDERDVYTEVFALEHRASPLEDGTIELYVSGIMP